MHLYLWICRRNKQQQCGGVCATNSNRSLQQKPHAKHKYQERPQRRRQRQRQWPKMKAKFAQDDGEGGATAAEDKRSAEQRSGRQWANKQQKIVLWHIKHKYYGKHFSRQTDTLYPQLEQTAAANTCTYACREQHAINTRIWVEQGMDDANGQVKSRSRWVEWSFAACSSWAQRLRGERISWHSTTCVSE